MADRQITATRRDEDGDITHLCNEGASWSPVTKADAIEDIEADPPLHRSLVKSGNDEVDIIVVHRGSGVYLRTEPDLSKADNLDNLPDR